MNHNKYKTFPIHILAFLRVAIGVAIGLANPLYFIEESIDPNIIGIITSGTAMAYLFSPFIFRNIHKKIGMKSTVIFASLGFLVVQIVLQITKQPFIVFLLLILDGLSLGLFWPVLMAAISNISNLDEYREDDRLKDKLMKTYSLSWNLGGIFCYLLGTIILFFIDIIELMYLFALIFAVIGFLISLILQEPSNHFDREIIIPIDGQIKALPKREQIEFPLFLPLILIIIYGFSIGGVGLIYPIKSELLLFPLYTNYLFFLFRMTTQTIIITKSMDFSIKSLKRYTPISNLIVVITLLIMGINQNPILFGILFCLFGIFNSLYYTLSFKLLVFRNISENTSKYSIYFETMMGIGFFFSPIITGFIASYNVNFSFYLLTLLSSLGLIFFLFLNKKIKSE
jgi:MFS family permease